MNLKNRLLYYWHFLLMLLCIAGMFGTVGTFDNGDIGTLEAMMHIIVLGYAAYGCTFKL